MCKNNEIVKDFIKDESKVESNNNRLINALIELKDVIKDLSELSKSKDIKYSKNMRLALFTILLTNIIYIGILVWKGVL
jgi:hypothetical protein